MFVYINLYEERTPHIECINNEMDMKITIEETTEQVFKKIEV